MAISVGVAKPGTISGVGVANPGNVTGVGVANGGTVSGVVNNYGQQQQPFSGTPINLVPGVSAAGSAQLAKNQSTMDGIQAQYQAMLKQIQAASTPKPAIQAPPLDFAGLQTQARAAAEGDVNPYYMASLNSFLAQQAHLKAQQQSQYDTNVQNIQDTLRQTQEANALTGARTTEDVAAKQALINTANDQNQVDTGNQFEDARLAAAKGQATAGILGSGAGNRQTGQATTARNTTEGRQNEEFQQQRQQQELFKSRTFEDLAKSTELAGTAAAKGKTAAKFDLDSYIQNASDTELNYRNDQEIKRKADVANKEADKRELILNNWYATMSNPAQAEAARRAYG